MEELIKNLGLVINATLIATPPCFMLTGSTFQNEVAS